MRDTGDKRIKWGGEEKKEERGVVHLGRIYVSEIKDSNAIPLKK